MFFSKATVAACLLLAASSSSGVDGYSFTPARSTSSSPFSVSTYKYGSNNARPATGASSLTMISTGDDRSERKSLDISKTQYTSLVKAPKDSYIAFAEKGKSNAK
jgi:hypothetical protein